MGRAASEVDISVRRRVGDHLHPYTSITSRTAPHAAVWRLLSHSTSTTRRTTPSTSPIPWPSASTALFASKPTSRPHLPGKKRTPSGPSGAATKPDARLLSRIVRWWTLPACRRRSNPFRPYSHRAPLGRARRPRTTSAPASRFSAESRLDRKSQQHSICNAFSPIRRRSLHRSSHPLCLCVWKELRPARRPSPLRLRPPLRRPPMAGVAGPARSATNWCERQDLTRSGKY